MAMDFSSGRLFQKTVGILGAWVAGEPVPMGKGPLICSNREAASNPQRIGDDSMGDVHCLRMIDQHGLTTYVVQVRHPSFEDIDILTEAGLLATDPRSELFGELENSTVFMTMDEESAYAVVTPDQWETTTIHHVRVEKGE